MTAVDEPDNIVQLHPGIVSELSCEADARLQRDLERLTVALGAVLCSYGVARYEWDDARDTELLAQADELYADFVQTLGLAMPMVSTAPHPQQRWCASRQRIRSRRTTGSPWSRPDVRDWSIV